MPALGERGVEDPAREAVVQTLGGPEHPAEPADVLPEDDHPVALVHRVTQGCRDGPDQVQLDLGAHTAPPLTDTSCPLRRRLRVSSGGGLDAA